MGLNNCLIPDPTDAPICTIGPSRPAPPPEPMLNADVTIFGIMSVDRIKPPWRLLPG